MDPLALYTKGAKFWYRAQQMPRLKGSFRHLAGDQSQTLPCDANEVKRVALKYERKGFALWNTIGSCGLTPENCFNAIVLDGLYTIVLVLSNMEDINRL